MLQDVPFDEIKTVEDLKKYNALYQEVLHIAQFESEVELGVNPKSVDQADVTYLSEDDSGYITNVYKLVAKRLTNSDWVVKAVKKVETRFLASPESIKGVRYDNELFKGNKGILEDYMREISRKNMGDS